LYKLAKRLPTHCRKWHYRNFIFSSIRCEWTLLSHNLLCVVSTYIIAHDYTFLV